MRRLVAVALLTLLGILARVALVSAETPSTTLLPGNRVDYRFDYRGDASQIRIAVDSSDADAVVLSIYTPTQMDSLRRGDAVAPVGRGTPSRDHDLFWAGGFKIPGVYHAILENRSQGAILYSIEISGDSVSGAAPVVAAASAGPSGIVSDGGTRYLVVNVPSGPSLRLALPRIPIECTPAKQVPSVIASSIKLCPNQIYPPLQIRGNNIGLFADDAHSAVVTSAGRQFAVTLEGNGNWIEGITVQARADPQDINAWLCLYEECIFPTRPVTSTLRGGVRYGGGILLRGSNSVVHAITVRGGTIGVATVDGRSNYLVDNKLNDLNGWGSFNTGSVGSYYIGNEFSRENHGCTTPDGRKFLNGCETSGWVCLGCQANWIARNQCELSANCFYMSGERGLASNDNRLISNYCAGASDNCFEITFSQRNLLQQNTATVDPHTDKPCKYPFWIGGSVTYFRDNTWQCTIGAEDALSQARDSTVVATNIVNLTTTESPPAQQAGTAARKPPAILPRWGLAFVE